MHTELFVLILRILQMAEPALILLGLILSLELHLAVLLLQFPIPLLQLITLLHERVITLYELIVPSVRFPKLIFILVDNSLPGIINFYKVRLLDMSNILLVFVYFAV